MNDITRKRAQRVIERQVADGSMIRLGDGQIIERDRCAQQTASQAVIMTSTTGHGTHLDPPSAVGREAGTLGREPGNPRRSRPGVVKASPSSSVPG